jgi:capsular polysaccharide biosynthesis protein
MDFGEMFRLLLRRWFIAVPLLLITLVGTAGTYKAWPTKYQGQVQLTLLSSRSVASAQGNAGNPYLDFTPAMDSVVDLIARNLSSDQSASQLQALGVTYPYTAGIASNAQGPFLAITVTGRKPAVIMQQLPIIVKFAQQRLAEIQRASSAPKNSLIQLILIAPPNSPTKVLKTKIEIVAAVFVIGLICSFLFTFIANNILSRRDRPQRRNGHATAANERIGAARIREWPEQESHPAETR